MTVLLLGFSSGLPLVLVGSTLQAWYASAGINLMTIGMLTLVGQPYLYKFLWAPFFDRYTPLPLGRRRCWILLTQLSLVLGLISMALLQPQREPGWLAVLALIVAFCSASQDIAIDAYRTDLLPEQERGLGAALASLGWRMAILVAGAMALVLADHIGWKNTYLFMAGLLVLELFITLWAPSLSLEPQAPTSLWQAMLVPVREFLQRPQAWLMIVFIVSYKLCDAFALALNTTFLLRGVGFSLTTVGMVTKVIGLSAALLGSLVGGLLLPALGLYRALLYFGILQLLSNLPFALLAVIGPHIGFMAITVGVENFCGGLSSVGLIVLLMDLCNKKYTATQYAMLSALAAVGRVFVGPIAAGLVDALGWMWFYLMTGIIGLPPLFLLKWLHYRYRIFISPAYEIATANMNH